MRTLSLRRVCTLFALIFALPVAGEDMTLVPLTDGVWAVLQPHAERFNDSNSLIVIGETDVIVVDAQARPHNVQRVIAYVRELTDRPVSKLINTHWHADHVQGNAIYREAYGDDLEIIGHESLLRDVPGRAEADHVERVAQVIEALAGADKRFEAGVGEDGEALTESERADLGGRIERTRRWLDANRDAKFLPPTRTFREQLTIDAGGVQLVLMHAGAHTDGDTLVWLPASGILAAGDVVDDLPFAGHGHPRAWARTLTELSTRGVRIYVPGHGPLFRDQQKLLAIRQFMTDLSETVALARQSGLSREEIGQRMKFALSRRALAGEDEGAQQFFDAVLGDAIDRAFEEAAP